MVAPDPPAPPGVCRKAPHPAAGRGQVRPARPGDMRSVFLMGWDAWGEGRSRDKHVEECLASPKYAKGRWWVLEEGGRPASALIAYPMQAREGLPAVGIGSVQTEPSLRGRGLAARLVAEVMRLNEAEGIGLFILHSDIGAAYYSRLGFEPLPDRFQLKTGSILMMRGPREILRSLWADPSFQAPPYF